MRPWETLTFIVFLGIAASQDRRVLASVEICESVRRVLVVLGRAPAELGRAPAELLAVAGWVGILGVLLRGSMGNTSRF